MPNRQLLANAIRALSMDAVQKANSGHPGMPLGMADIAEVLWNDFLQHNPADPQWWNRDRFVVSNGHGSMLLYSLLHLSGYELSIDDLKNFRQLHSKTPGHPEFGEAPGVETTTGPLGQGLANAVGMAIAERTLAAQYNRDQHQIIDHHTYVFVGDGCLMEGISHEVSSLAGTLGLGKLICFYDDNGISIDGKTEGWFKDNTPKRFEAYGWQTIANVDGHDGEAIKQAILAAKAETNKPTLICCKTEIAHGAPNLAGTSKSHGAPLGAEEIAATRKNIGWEHKPFEIPEEVYVAWSAKETGSSQQQKWAQRFAAYQEVHPELAVELTRRINQQLPENWQSKNKEFIRSVIDKAEGTATRKASQKCLNTLGPILPELFGGSADLGCSNLTTWSDSQAISANDAGNYLDYGVREFGMAAIMNGIALHGGFLPYGGTFLTFLDYARNAVRLSAMMKQRVIYVFTHDSIGLGEDGPTHQPVEHISMLRVTPGLTAWRPCDEVETVIAWQQAIEQLKAPTCLLLSRQSLPYQQRNEQALENIKRGGYVLLDCAGTPEKIIIATGSEVSIAVEAAKQLQAQGKAIRVVSMPSTDVFATQDIAYQESVLPNAVTDRIAVEAGASDFWYKYVGREGKVIGIDSFGVSAPASDAFEKFGFTVEHLLGII